MDASSGRPKLLTSRGDQVDAICLADGDVADTRGVNVIGLLLPRYRGASRIDYLRSYINFFSQAAALAIRRSLQGALRRRNRMHDARFGNTQCITLSAVRIEVSTRRSRYDAGAVSRQVRRTAWTIRRADADAPGTVERAARGSGACGARPACRTPAAIRRAATQAGGDCQLARSAHLSGRGHGLPVASSAKRAGGRNIFNHLPRHNFAGVWGWIQRSRR